MTDLLYSDTENALRDSVRSLLAAHCPTERVTAMYDGDAALATDLWQTVSNAMELPGVGIPEAFGGGGASAREVAVVMEELGRHVAPIPFLTSSVIAAKILGACGAQDNLRSLVGGDGIAILSVPLSTSSIADLALPSLTEAGLVDGRVRMVADAGMASVFIVPVTSNGDLTIQLVEASDPGVTVSPRSSLDMTRPLADVAFAGATGTEIARGPGANEAIRAGLLHGAAMLAAEQVGIAEWCLESTVAYAKQRHQFGRAIGSFQAIKHRLAHLWIAVDSARAAARNAAALVDGGGPDALTAVALAGAYCSDVAVLAAEECVQLHGGIGMTWEHPAHLYLKRAKADQVALGTSAHHRAVLAQLHGL